MDAVDRVDQAIEGAELQGIRWRSRLPLATALSVVLFAIAGQFVQDAAEVVGSGYEEVAFGHFDHHDPIQRPKRASSSNR